MSEILKSNKKKSQLRPLDVLDSFGSFNKLSSEEYSENNRREELSLFDDRHHLASSLKRLVNLQFFIDLHYYKQ